MSRFATRHCELVVPSRVLFLYSTFVVYLELVRLALNTTVSLDFYTANTMSKKRWNAFPMAVMCIRYNYSFWLWFINTSEVSLIECSSKLWISYRQLVRWWNPPPPKKTWGLQQVNCAINSYPLNTPNPACRKLLSVLQRQN